MTELQGAFETMRITAVTFFRIKTITSVTEQSVGLFFYIPVIFSSGCKYYNHNEEHDSKNH